jgi:hypothetical protein
LNKYNENKLNSEDSNAYHQAVKEWRRNIKKKSQLHHEAIYVSRLFNFTTLPKPENDFYYSSQLYQLGQGNDILLFYK